MTTFKLYDELQGKVQEEAISVDDWKKVCAIINNLPQQYTKIISCIIIHHYMLTNELTPENLLALSSKNKFSSIYGVKLMNNGKGQLFNTKKLPDDLQKLIYTFIMNVVE